MPSFAAIHIGSETVSLQIVEYKDVDDIRVLDRARRQMDLGEEAFKSGQISFASVSEICELLKGFRRLCSEYGVRDCRVMATTALREAENQQYIIDQIRIKTGLEVEIVDMPQEIFYKYMALFKHLQTSGLANTEDGLLFVDISSGGTGITLYRQGAIRYQQNINIGAMRIKESFAQNQRDDVCFQQVLDEYIESAIDPIAVALMGQRSPYLVLTGNETRLLLQLLGHSEGLAVLSPKELKDLYRKVRRLNLPELMTRFDLNEADAALVIPALGLYCKMMEVAAVDHVLVPTLRFIDGMTLLHVAEKTDSRWLDVMEEHTFSVVKALEDKFHYDKAHASVVEEFSLLLFDKLNRYHGLGRRERLMLRAAAHLHDIGKFVNLRRHYFYSYRLIESADILGISRSEKRIIANVSYYHSKGTPNNADENFTRLSNKAKLTVAKLSAIIRLADALDRSHRQKITDCSVQIKGDEMLVNVKAREDLSLEEWTFAEKAEFFESVFGLKARVVGMIGGNHGT